MVVVPFSLRPSQAIVEVEHTIPKRGGRDEGFATSSFRHPYGLDARILSAREGQPGRWPSKSAFIVDAIDHLLEISAAERGDDALVALIRENRALEANKAKRSYVLGTVESLAGEIKDLLSRGMIEKAHAHYADTLQAFRLWSASSEGDEEWSTEGVKLLEARVLPLLPQRPPMDLRRGVKRVRTAKES